MYLCWIIDPCIVKFSESANQSLSSSTPDPLAACTETVLCTNQVWPFVEREKNVSWYQCPTQRPFYSHPQACHSFVHWTPTKAAGRNIAKVHFAYTCVYSLGTVECKQQVLSQCTVAMLMVPRSQAVMSQTGSKLWQLTDMFSWLSNTSFTLA